VRAWNRKTHKQFVKEIAKKTVGLAPDSPSYTSSKIKLKFLCKACGFLWNSTPDSILSGHGCTVCGAARRKEKNSLTIEEAERRYPDMVRGQTWRGIKAKYNYECPTHGGYPQFFTNHVRGAGCPKCAVKLRVFKPILCAICGEETTRTNTKQKWCSKCAQNGNVISAKKYREAHIEELTVQRHYQSIFNPKCLTHRNYKGMPFFDGWNPDKGGSIKAGGRWIIDNLGRRPEGSSLHVIHHDIGFMPGNLEWTTPKKQINQQMFKIIAQQRHEIKMLKRQLIEAQQLFDLPQAA